MTNASGVGGSANFGGSSGAMRPTLAVDDVDSAEESWSTPPSTHAALPSTTTGTNTQVVGVDEADFVKSDGKNLYVLHGGVLELVQAWPVESLQGRLALALEGAPREMFVVGEAAKDEHRKVVVIADVDGGAVYAKAGISPSGGADKLGAGGSGAAIGMADVAPSARSAPPLGTGGSTGGGVSFDAGTAGGAGGTTNTGPDHRGAAVTNPPSSPAVGVTSPDVWTGGTPMTKVTVIDATDSSLEVVSQVYYDGTYQSARRQGDRVHAVFGISKAWPSLETCATSSERLKAEMVVLDRMAGQNRDVAAVPAEEIEREVLDALVDVVLTRNQASLDAISYADYVPHRFPYDGSNLAVETLPCERMYLPKAGSSAWGVTYVAEIDLANPNTDPGSQAILGQAGMLYENGTALVLATNSSESRPYPNGWAEVAYLHRFGLTAAGLSYEASAQVDGRIKDQFSLDVKADTLRVVLSEGRRTSQTNRLEILQGTKETGVLQRVGVVTGIGDKEEVRSVRYVGDTAYVVTFVQTDPLFTIDVSNPTQPRITGELPDIPGFSTYMHPIDENHLLTIGYENGVNMLQIFDVTDKSKAAIQRWKLPLEASGSSAAAEEYKAFTYYPEQRLLAIPFVSYSSSPYSAMLVFSVEVDKGIQLLGRVDGDFISGIPSASNQRCYYYGQSDSTFSRSVFFDDVLYAIAQQGIAAVRARTPTDVLGRLVFPGGQSTSYGCDYYDKEPWGETGGAAGRPMQTGGSAGIAGGGFAGSWETGGAVDGGAGGAGGAAGNAGTPETAGTMVDGGGW